MQHHLYIAELVGIHFYNVVSVLTMNNKKYFIILFSGILLKLILTYCNDTKAVVNTNHYHPKTFHDNISVYDSLINLVSQLSETEKVSMLMGYSREYSLTEPSLSLELVKTAHQIATENGDLLQISRTLNGLFIINYYLGNNKTALEYLHEGVAFIKGILVKYPDSIEFRNRLNAFYNNAGNLYQSMGKMKKSLEMFQNCLRMLGEQRQKSPENKSYEMAYIKTLNNIVILFWDMGKIDKARVYLNEALDLSKKGKNPEMMYLSLNNLGLIQLEENHYEEALNTFSEIKQIHQNLNDSMG